jgi:hypothetical protein
MGADAVCTMYSDLIACTTFYTAATSTTTAVVTAQCCIGAAMENSIYVKWYCLYRTPWRTSTMYTGDTCATYDGSTVL